MFEEKPMIRDAEIQEAMDFAVSQILGCLPEFTDKFQKPYSENGFYHPIGNDEWTTGFWTGQI